MLFRSIYSLWQAGTAFTHNTTNAQSIARSKLFSLDADFYGSKGQLDVYQVMLETANCGTR